MVERTTQEHEPNLRYWLGFNLVSGIGPAKVQALLDHFGDIASAWHATEDQLQRIGIDKRAAQALLEARQALDLEAELERVRKARLGLLSWESADYPRLLREIPAAPPLIYVRGRLRDQDQWAVAVVGTRRLTAYGRQVTQDLVGGLSRSGITIVSGLAKGIDAIAHRTALDSGGRTIAVLGCGLDQIYPPEHRALAAEIVADRGALVSDYGLGMTPEARNFPARNRLISGLSLGTVVVEAGERSGALITASFATEHSREVFAVPGNINSPASRGANRLIQQGAKLVGSVDDILEELNVVQAAEHTVAQMALPESAEEVLCWPIFRTSPCTLTT
jgi:DNA processing protein